MNPPAIQAARAEPSCITHALFPSPPAVEQLTTPIHHPVIPSYLILLSNSHMDHQSAIHFPCRKLPCSGGFTTLGAGGSCATTAVPSTNCGYGLVLRGDGTTRYGEREVRATARVIHDVCLQVQVIAKVNYKQHRENYASY